MSDILILIGFVAVLYGLIWLVVSRPAGGPADELQQLTETIMSRHKSPNDYYHSPTATYLPTAIDEMYRNHHEDNP